MNRRPTLYESVALPAELQRPIPFFCKAIPLWPAAGKIGRDTRFDTRQPTEDTITIQKNTSEKPKKPYPDFPLFPHATGRWVKKIKGRLVYFGPWDDPEGALAKYLDTRDDLQAGRPPRDKTDGLAVRELVNRFLTAKRHLVDTRELSPGRSTTTTKPA